MSDVPSADLAPRHCTCPRGLGYRFHRFPCARAGEIEEADRD